MALDLRADSDQHALAVHGADEALCEELASQSAE